MRTLCSHLHLRLLGLTARARTDRGASLVEYSMLVALIALVCFAALDFFGAETGASLNSSSKSLVSN